MRWARLSAALAALALGGAASGARADTFCVAAPSCTGTAEPTLPAALSAAAGSFGRDRIELGATTIPYAGLATDSAGNPVDIVGAGRHQTTLQASGGTLLAMQEPSSTLTDVGIVASGSPAAVADLGAGSFVRVDLDATATDPAATVVGVRMHGGGAVLDDVAITMASGQVNFAVRSDAPAAETAPVVRHLTAAGQTAVGLIGDGALGIESSDLRGRSAAVRATAGTITVDDTLVRVSGAVGLSAAVPSAAGAGAQVVARHVTVLLSSAATGVEATSSTAGRDAAVHVSNSVIHGGGLAATASGVAGAHADVTLDYSAYAFASTSASGTATITGGTAAHDLDDPPPGFVDENAGDVHLIAASALIDAGDPGAVAGPSTDLGGLPRVRDGNGDGAAVRDIGAFEYQRAAPTVSAVATPSSAGIDQEVALSALTVDADAGETASITWSFDDGTTATGATTSHAFATAGDHTATATATDPTGLTGTDTVTVHVIPDNAGPDIDHTGPRLFVRVLRRRLDRHRTFLIGVFCPADERPRCTGSVTVRRGTARIASSALRITAGGTQIVKLRVSRATAALAHRRRELGVVATIVARDLLGNPTTRTVRLVLRPLR